MYTVSRTTILPVALWVCNLVYCFKGGTQIEGV